MKIKFLIDRWTEDLFATPDSHVSKDPLNMQEWLLRLFQSDFFNCWIAVSYLYKYPDIGVQDYLCRRLREFPLEDVEFLLPQLCHLLVSRVSEAMALEFFLLELCQSSTHVAVLTLWYLEGYLKDYSAFKSWIYFERVSRLIQKFQLVLAEQSYRNSFHSPLSPLIPNHNKSGEHLRSLSESGSRIDSPSSSIYFNHRQVSPTPTPPRPSLSHSSLALPPFCTLDYIRIYHNISPILLGMSCVAASLAAPRLLEHTRALALMQGGQSPIDLAACSLNKSSLTTKSQSTGASFHSLSLLRGSPNSSTSSTSSSSTPNNSRTLSLMKSKSSSFLNKKPSSSPLLSSNRFPQGPPTLEELHHGRAFSFHRYLAKNRVLSKMMHILPYNAKGGGEDQSSSLDTDDNFRFKSQNSPPSPSPGFFSPSMSRRSSSFSAAYPGNLKGITSNQTGNLTSMSMSTYKKYSIGHYYHSEMQFVNSLIDISYRLTRIPKEARQKALQAELSLLNFNLPANVCLPLWCPIGKKIKMTSGHQQPTSVLADKSNSDATSPSLDSTMELLGGLCQSQGETECIAKYHHQIVRIPPNDAVILNSAERVPYLILVEVLENESEESIYEMMEKVNREKEERKHAARQLAGSSSKSIRSASLSTSPIGVEEETNRSRSVEGLSAAEPAVINNLSQENKVHTDHRLDKRLLLDATKWKKKESTPFPTAPCLDLDLTKTLMANAEVEIQRSEGNRTPEVFPPSWRGTVSPPNFPSSSPTSSHSFKLTTISNEDFNEKMRTAAILLAQLHDITSSKTTVYSTAVMQIRDKIIKEMEGLEMTRLTMVAAATSSKEESHRQKSESQPPSSIQLEEQEEAKRLFILGTTGFASPSEGVEAALDRSQLWKLKEEAALMEKLRLSKADPSAVVLKEHWKTKEKRIRTDSPFGWKPNWRLLSVIVKSGADLRQEQLACQLIREMQHIWQIANVKAWLYYYRVLVTSDNSGLIETITDAISIHSIKKEAYMSNLLPISTPYTIKDHFHRKYGAEEGEKYKAAQLCFMQSLAGYCIATYILALKDRHNGNILLNHLGHMIHIDFGFMLSNSPGYVGFEKAPFKLTAEYVELLDGLHSPLFSQFKELLLQAFLALRKHADRLVLLVDMMHHDSKLPCFYSGEAAVQHIRDRFQLTLTDSQVKDYVDRLVAASFNNMFTRLYDTFQYYSNGIL